MNYKELEKANGLLEEIKEIDLKLRQLEHPFYRVRITIEDYQATNRMFTWRCRCWTASSSPKTKICGYSKRNQRWNGWRIK